jgi:hypothetical protein
MNQHPDHQLERLFSTIEMMPLRSARLPAPQLCEWVQSLKDQVKAIRGESRQPAHVLWPHGHILQSSNFGRSARLYPRPKFLTSPHD